MYKNTIYLLIFSISFAFTQNMWIGNSVATSDNVDALHLNPAGLGINRTISSVFLPVSTLDNLFYVETVDRYGNFGFSTKYVDGDRFFNPTDFNIGFGYSISENLYSGITWNKHHTLTLGMLYRPFNFSSFGATITGPDDNITDISNTRFGFALRPFGGNSILTIGTDVDWYSTPTSDGGEKEKTWHRGIPIPFIEINFMQGISLSFCAYGEENIDIETETTTGSWEFNNFSINLGVSFGKNGLFGQSNSDNNKIQGLGFYTSKSTLPSILNFAQKYKKDEKETWVRMNMEGMFIEEPVSKSPFDFNFNLPFLGSGFDGPVFQLRAWVEKLDRLTNNDEISGLIIDWKYVIAGFAKRQEIYDALMRFKNSGKKIIIYSKEGFTNNDYFQASLADEIYMHEDGIIDLRGFNVEMQFFRGLLDTLDIVPEIIAISPYKSAGDALTRKDISPEVKENYGKLFGGIYSQFINGISKGRGWENDYTESVIDKGPFFSDEILDNNLISEFKYPDQFEEYVKKINNGKNNIQRWNSIEKKELYSFDWVPEVKPKIAVIYAVGGINSGENITGKTGSTVMGDETMRQAIKTAREDKSIRAIVLRIDSPGGSGSASDLIWREIIKTTDKDTANVKPFIASMSDLAASGGYYIACQADTIVAHPGTITGSIGVLGGRLNLSGFMNKIGINYDRITFGKNSDYWSGGKLWDEDEKKRFREMIIEFYGKFVTKVADGRENLDSLNVDAVALGQVWTGEDAKDLDLVDEIGGLQRSIEIAKQAAGISNEQDIEIVEYPHFKPFDLLKEAFENNNTNVILPKPFENYQEFYDLMELLSSDDILYLMPYKIEIK